MPASTGAAASRNCKQKEKEQPAAQVTMALLATFPEMQRKRGKHAGSKRTQWWTWQEPAWVADRVACLPARDADLSGKCQLLGLVLLSPGAMWQEDGLQSWGMEAEFLWRLALNYMWPLYVILISAALLSACSTRDCFVCKTVLFTCPCVVCSSCRYFKKPHCASSYRVQGAFPLLHERTVLLQRSSYGSAGISALQSPARSMVFQLLPEDLTVLARSNVADGRTVAEVLSERSVLLEALLCVRQPEPAARLIACNQGHEILLLPTCYNGNPVGGKEARLPLPHSMRFDVLCQGFPDQDWICHVWSDSSGGNVRESPAINGDTLEHLKAFLRRCVNAVDTNIAKNLRADAVKCVAVVDSLMRSFCSAVEARHKGKNIRYTAEQLLHAFLATHHMRSAESAFFAAEHICNLLFPGLFQEVMANMPSSTTLRRSKTQVDMAVLRLSQIQNRAAAQQGRVLFRYGWSDSSPIAGRDWFLSKHVCIDAEAAQLCYVAARMLALDTGGQVAAAHHAQQREEDGRRAQHAAPGNKSVRPFIGNDMEPEEEPVANMDAKPQTLSSQHRQRLASYIKGAVSCHVHVPTSVASGHTTLEYKAACLVHQVGMECENESDLNEWFLNVRSWTTDLGTEAGLAQCHVPPAQLLPSWWEWPPTLVHDGEDGGTDSNVLSAGWGSMVDAHSLMERRRMPWNPLNTSQS